jgi:ABC-type multidrug transport system fused ATPase/permease subunit
MLNWLTECDEGLPEEGGALEALSECKLRVGDAAEAGFDWLQDNLAGVFDAMAAALEVMIDAILALLQEPPNTGWIYDLRRSEIEYLYPEAWHPILITAIFAALAWWLHRSWKMPALIVIGLLFVINQGYWDETTESLTLVLSACVVCMGLGVPIGIAAAHRPRLYAAMRPVLDLMQTLPTFVYLIPAIVFFGIGMVPGPDRHGDLRPARADPADASGHLVHAAIADGGGGCLRRHAQPEAVEGGASLCAAPDHDGAEPDDHAVAFHGGDRGAGGGRRPRRAGRARAQPGEHRARLRGGVDHRGRGDPARPPAQGAVEMSTVVRFNEVCIMFGPAPARALEMADAGGTREDIQAATTHVLGVHDCTLEVEEGEILVLMGLSGSGKSTLLRAVNGLNPVARGSVEVQADGGHMVDVTHADAKTLRELRQSRVAMVFQAFGLLPWRTVRENVGFGLELSGLPRRSAMPGSTGSCRSSACPTGPTARWASCRAACSSAWASPAPSPPTRRSS